jgi:glutamate/aspartate transport system permease protein
VSYHWNWHIFWEMSPDGQGTYWHSLMVGLYFTLATALFAWIMALILGAIVGTARTLPIRWPRRVGYAYVELFRNIPLLVQMFLWYFVAPEVVPHALGLAIKASPNSAFYTAVVCLGFFTSARIAEQFRAAIGSLPSGQKLAATALGLSLGQVYVRVLLPQAVRIIVPTLTSEFLNIMKNSAVALTIGVTELAAQAHAMQEFSFQIFEPFTAATLIYVAVNAVVLLLMRQVERKLGTPRNSAIAMQIAH